MLSDGGPLGFCGGRTEHDSFDQSRKIDINKDAVFRNRDAKFFSHANGDCEPILPLPLKGPMLEKEPVEHANATHVNLCQIDILDRTTPQIFDVIFRFETEGLEG